MLAMLTDLTIAIHRRGFRWKESSLEYLACGCAGPPSALHISVSLGDDEKSCNPKDEVVRPQEHTHFSEPISHTIPQVTQTIVLGTMLDIEFSDHAVILHRLKKARPRFWNDADFYTSAVIPMGRKLHGTTPEFAPASST
eukprot:8883732-Pyramimonas_sp.AAC.1